MIPVNDISLACESKAKNSLRIKPQYMHTLAHRKLKFFKLNSHSIYFQSDSKNFSLSIFTDDNMKSFKYSNQIKFSDYIMKNS